MGSLAVGLLEPAAGKVEGGGSIEEDVSVGRIEEALLLVSLRGEDGEPKVHGDEADGEGECGRGLPGHAITLIAKAFRVHDGGDEEGGKGEQGQREQDVEAEERVAEVEGRRLGAVQGGTSSWLGEDVILDDVEGNNRELPVSLRVDVDDGDLRRKPSAEFNFRPSETAHQETSSNS